MRQSSCVLLLVSLLVCLWFSGCGGGVPDEHMAKGQKLLADGKKEAAIGEFTKAIEIDPDCVKAYLNRAMCYNETGKPRQAVADFSKAIDLNPNDAYPYDQRAILYRNVLNEPEKAAADTAKAEAIRDKRWDDLKDLRKRHAEGKR